MVSLAAVAGICSPSCMPSATVPPDVSRRRLPPSSSPDMARTIPHSPGLFPSPRLPTLSINPWKPDVSPRDWSSIVIHHTGTSRGSVESIHQTHLKRKDSNGNPWLGIGYHFVVGNGDGMPDGRVEPTFRWRQQLHGAHAGDRDYNEHGIGVALVGNFEQEPPTPAQLAAVKRLVGVLKTGYSIKSENVIGHGDIKATACPGRYFPMAEVSRSLPQFLFGERQQAQSPANEVAGLRRNWMP